MNVPSGINLANLNKAEELLAKIQAHINVLKAEENAHWGHVGTSGAIVERLDEIVDFLEN